MKMWFLLLLTLITSSVAFAATTATIPARSMKMTGDGSRPAMLDLSAELRKQKLGQNDSARLIQIDLKVKAGFTGATFGLMMNGVAVSSHSVHDDTEQSFTLSADSNSTPAPWILAVRGDAQLIEIRLTMDSAAANPEPEPSLPSNPTTPGEDPGTTPEEPTEPEENIIGTRVIVVSQSAGGVIDYALVQRKSPSGSYVVLYQGKEIPKFQRHQIGLIFGCTGNICVGDRMSYFDSPVTIIARLDSGLFVTERGDGQRMVVSSLELTAARVTPDEPGLPEPLKPSPKSPLSRRYFRGQAVLVVAKNSRTSDGTISGSSGSKILVATRDGILSIQDQTQIAVFEGCAGNFCLGQNVVTQDRSGNTHYAEVFAIQSNSLVVLRLFQNDALVGNWPVQALRR